MVRGWTEPPVLLLKVEWSKRICASPRATRLIELSAYVKLTRFTFLSRRWRRILNHAMKRTFTSRFHVLTLSDRSGALFYLVFSPRYILRNMRQHRYTTPILVYFLNHLRWICCLRRKNYYNMYRSGISGNTWYYVSLYTELWSFWFAQRVAYSILKKRWSWPLWHEQCTDRYTSANGDITG